MSGTVRREDLVVLCADIDTEYALQGLLNRRRGLPIRPLRATFFRHVQRDPGCLTDAHNFLRPAATRFTHALVVFDRHGCGRERLTRVELEERVEALLRRNGWEDRAAAVVIDPELEQWVWVNSPVVADLLGWRGRTPSLAQWLAEEGWWAPGAQKPQQPKEAMRAALHLVHRPLSAALFKQLAESVSFEACSDGAFAKLKNTLLRWFPPV